MECSGVKLPEQKLVFHTDYNTTFINIKAGTIVTIAYSLSHTGATWWWFRLNDKVWWIDSDYASPCDLDCNNCPYRFKCFTER